MRTDGRGPNDLRPVKITPDFVPSAEGSVLIEMGSTRVIVTATVVDGVPAFLKGTGKGWVTGEYGMLPRSTEERTPRESVRAAAWKCPKRISIKLLNCCEAAMRGFFRSRPCAPRSRTLSLP